jgi:acetyl-CoA acetyltransferase
LEMDDAPRRHVRGLGLRPDCVVTTGGWLEQVPLAATRLADRTFGAIALLFAAPFRSGGRLFGGEATNVAPRDSYGYYHPWRWSSQAAHWALMWRHYMLTYGAAEADLAHVAVTLRQHASLTEDAIMRHPLSINDYLGSRYIVEPLHLFDLCLANDGAVCIIMQRAEGAADRPHPPVLLSGWGYGEVLHSKLDVMIRDRLGTPLRTAAGQALSAAGLERPEIGHLMAYDASTIHLVAQLEGLGFAEAGDGLTLVKAGETSLTGALPTNTNGGMLSHSYMAGWNNLVEAVRQLRHEAGARQVAGLHATMYAATNTEGAITMVLSRG